jgi:quercetin dioxygenase-like cupin family protein
MRIVPADEHRGGDEGSGWRTSILADLEIIGAPAMRLDRITLEPGATGPEVLGDGTERFVYVMRGSGTAAVGGDRLPLAHEAVVWIEAGDRLILEASGEGLEILVAVAGAGAASS